MRTPAIIAAFAFLCADPASAGKTEEESAAAFELTSEKKTRALAFLKSTDASKRAGAIKAFRGLGGDHKKAYKEILEAAHEHHAKYLDKKAFDLAFDRNSLTAFADLQRAWAEKRDAALKMVLTNLKKDQAKQTEMDTKFASADAAYARMQRASERAGRSELPLLQPRVEAIAQIDRELVWCDGASVSRATPPELVAVLRHIDAGEKLIPLLRNLEAVRGSNHAVVIKHNASQSWASPAQKSFANLLNSRRLVLGQPLLRLDENLCRACLGHSREMGSLGYFSHNSPTEKNRTFGKRAKNAGFKGRASGECIYTGGGGSAGAHKAWWYSDGHRLIMYAKNPNTLGIANAGNLWTLNTGKRKW